jgi:hypothetical protein
MARELEQCVYKHCKGRGVFYPRTADQRFCSKQCQDDYAYDVRRAKNGVVKPRKRRLGSAVPGSAENGHIPSIETTTCGSHISYYFVESRTVPPKQKGMIPQGPPPPLSEVEIAALGGYVVKVVPRPYVPKPVQYVDTPSGPTPGALQGDDYPLEYDADGYPILPACLDRRKPKLEIAA